MIKLSKQCLKKKTLSKYGNVKRTSTVHSRPNSNTRHKHRCSVRNGGNLPTLSKKLRTTASLKIYVTGHKLHCNNGQTFGIEQMPSNTRDSTRSFTSPQPLALFKFNHLQFTIHQINISGGRNWDKTLGKPWIYINFCSLAWNSSPHTSIKRLIRPIWRHFRWASGEFVPCSFEITANRLLSQWISLMAIHLGLTSF